MERDIVEAPFTERVQAALRLRKRRDRQSHVAYVVVIRGRSGSPVFGTSGWRSTPGTPSCAGRELQRLTPEH
jgi:hypothetical protein